MTFMELDSTPLQLLNNFGDTSTLSSSETKELLIRNAHGDKEARKLLMTHNAPYVYRCAQKHIVPMANMSELVQAGLEGLIEAIDNISKIEEKGIISKENVTSAFINYAKFPIQDKIREALRESEPFHLSDGQFRRIRKIRGINRRLQEETSLTASERIAAIAEEMSLPIYKVLQSFNASEIVSSLEQPLKNDEDSYNLEDTISCQDQKQPNLSSSIFLNQLFSEQADSDGTSSGFGFYEMKESDLEYTDQQNIFNSDLPEILSTGLETLTDMEKDVVSLHLGLNDNVELSFQDIGDRYGHTKQWASNLCQKALGKLKTTCPDVDAYYYTF